jgi:5-methyltetrahydrofolate--homocysteine methyltransferase
MEHIDAIFKAVLEGDAKAAASGVEQALKAGMPADTVMREGLIPAMTEVGRLFEIGEYYVPEMLIAARAMQMALAMLKPHLSQDGAMAAGRVAIGTVKGDLHDIGKNLVGMMLEGAGFQVLDLGSDVAPGKFVELARAGHADILALSALLSTTMPAMKETIEAIESAGLRDRVKIIVGGAPVTEAYAKQIGADGYSPDAGGDARLAKELMSALRSKP